MFNYKIDLSTYYPSNDNKFNIYVDEMTNKVASNVSLPYVISMNIWKSSYKIYLENLSDGCGDVREIIVDGYTTTTTTLNFILTTTKYVPPTTLFTTTTTTTTTSTTITTITTQYVPPSTTTTTTTGYVPPSTTTTTTQPIIVGYKRWYNNPMSRTLFRNNCPSGCTPTEATYYVEYGKYYVDRLEGVDGQSDVDTIATQDLNDNTQNFVNNNANCVDCPVTIFWNTQQVINKTRNNCSPCEGTSVPFIIPANTYSSLISVEDANTFVINSNQENAQINANLNGQCVNCPQETFPTLYVTANVSCPQGNGYVALYGFGGKPFDNNSYEYKIGGGSYNNTLSNGGYGILLQNGVYTGFVRDSRGVEASVQFNIDCQTTTTTTTIPPCDCYKGTVRNVGEYFFTNCQGNGESGYIYNRDDIITSLCIDISQPYFNVNVLVKTGECNCS